MSVIIPKKRFENLHNLTKSSFFIPDFLTFFRTFLISSVILFLPIFLADRGINGWELGILFAAFTITNLVTTFPTGIINDNFAPKTMIALGFLFLAIFILGVTIFSGFWQLLGAFVIGGLGLNISIISLNSFMFKSAHRNKAEKEFGTYEFFRFFGSGIGILVIGGFLLDTFDFNLTFPIVAFAFLILMIFTFNLNSVKATHPKLIQYKSDIFRKEVFVFAIVFFLYAIHWGAERTAFSLFLVNNLGLTKIGAAAYMGATVLLLGITALYVSKYVHKIKQTKEFFFIGLGLSGVGGILMTIPSIGVSFGFRLVHEIGDGILVLLILVIVSHLFRKSRIGGDSTAFRSILHVGAAIGALVFGPIGFAYGYNYPLAIGGMLTLLALVLALMFRKHIYYHHNHKNESIDNI